jgi:hypothetical protein
MRSKLFPDLLFRSGKLGVAMPAIADEGTYAQELKLSLADHDPPVFHKTWGHETNGMTSRTNLLSHWKQPSGRSRQGTT